ncbi:MAG: antitoxin Xre/MbcA/ParS toxin-binding domain-containing protein [Xanthomonadaceae bacterium]|nr:antitoxin Xre/MbcA/ParS toxin-binding domain-containing protein [Xanthomonadaceae bacterium]
MIEGKPSRTTLPVKLQSFRVMLRTAPLTQRVEIERHGVPYQVVQGLIDEIGISNSDFQRYVRIPKATFVKKMKDKALFAGTTGQSVLGLMELINKVEAMLAVEHDNPEARHFDVEKWVGSWIQRPQPALGGLTPAELMDTPSGRESVMKVLGAIQSGAYQ